MNTVYEWLHEFSKDSYAKDDLISMYAEYDRVNCTKIKNREMSLSEIDAAHRQRVEAYISDILSCTPKENSEMVFFAVELFNLDNPRTEARLVSLKELENDHVETYGWSVTDREEWLGYHIADTMLTLSNISEMLANILYEASFYGYTRGEFEKGREELWQSIQEGEKEIEDGRCSTYPYEEFREKWCCPQEKSDSREEELKECVRHAEAALNQYCFDREIAALRIYIRDLFSEPDVETVHFTVVAYSYPYAVTESEYIRIHVADYPVILNDAGMELADQEIADFMAIFETVEDWLTYNFGLDLVYYDYLNRNGFLVKNSNGQPVIRFKSELRVANNRPNRTSEAEPIKAENDTQARLFRGKYLQPAQRDLIINGNTYNTYTDAESELCRIFDRIAGKNEEK